MAKSLLLKVEDIKTLIKGQGACLCTSMITVDGLPVGYMYRDEPEFEEDSGWRILAGTETDAYMEDPKNGKIYDLNTIANYDSSIIPHLHKPIGTTLERIPDTDEYRELLE